MNAMMKSWVRNLIIFGIFGVCINLIYLALPLYVMVVYDKVMFSFSESTLSTMIIGVLISLGMAGLLEFFRLKILEEAGNSLVKKMTPYVLKGMHEDAAGTQRQGYSRGLYDLELLRNAIVQGQLFYVLDLPWVLIYLGILFFIHPLTGAVTTAVVFMIALFQILLGILEKKRYVVTEVAFHANTEFARNSLQHAELVSGMGLLSPIQERYLERYQTIQGLQSEADAFHARIGTTIRFLQAVALVAVFAAGAFVFFTEKITAGAIIASVMLVVRLLYPFDRSLADMKISIEAMSAYKRLNHFIKIQEHQSKITLPAPEGRFAAEGVSLALGGKTIVHNISFALEPGESLAIIGPSAAGKTSLCKVLLGIWPASAGKVRLDGAEIAQWSEEDLGKYVGYMPQEPELFQGTVAENIARLMQVDSEKVVQAARNAGVHEMILRLVQGYDTTIDQTEKNLSAGQRQLISLGRAVYDFPKLVILDEPHAHLDDIGLKMVEYALQNMKKQNITTIVVTDRPNIVMKMDKLLVIRDGQVVTYGPAQEVLAQLSQRQQSQQAAGV